MTNKFLIDKISNENNNPPLPCSRKAIEKIVGKFYNLYNPEGNMLAIEKIFSVKKFFITKINILINRMTGLAQITSYSHHTIIV
jgi:hypothetical protein